jgi:molybdopterin converting factor small subunit
MSVKITVHYSAHARQAAGTATERVELPTPASLADLLACLAQRHADLGPLLRCTDGCGRDAVLIFLGDRQVRPGDRSPLRDGDEITLLPPIAGG